jgi:hypothetical protein
LLTTPFFLLVVSLPCQLERLSIETLKEVEPNDQGLLIKTGKGLILFEAVESLEDLSKEADVLEGSWTLAAAKEDGSLAPMNGRESRKDKHRSERQNFGKRATRSAMLTIPRLVKMKVSCSVVSLALLAMAEFSAA